MIIKSSAFHHNGGIPPKYTCDGKDINPALIIEDVPDNAKSLVLIVDDPDATHGATFIHWLMWNIPPQTSEIQEGDAPKGAVQGRNDFGNAEYGGPCPPQGSKPHRYMFKLFALDTILEIPVGSEKSELEKAIEGHIIEQTIFIGLYARTA